MKWKVQKTYMMSARALNLNIYSNDQHKSFIHKMSNGFNVFSNELGKVSLETRFLHTVFHVNQYGDKVAREKINFEA